MVWVGGVVSGVLVKNQRDTGGGTVSMDRRKPEPGVGIGENLILNKLEVGEENKRS